jgi:hypothetical protein
MQSPMPPFVPLPPPVSRKRSIRKYAAYVFVALLLLAAGAAAASLLPALSTRPSGTGPAPVPTTPTAIPTSTSTHGDFGAPELVTIEGYSGLTEDPYITSDEKYLLFDSAGSTDTPALFYAKKIDYKTFVYVGKIQGIGATGGGAPAIDTAGNFYFVSDRYRSQGISIAHGTFTDGVVTNLAPVEGISKNQVIGNMSASPSRDGTYLVFSDNSPRAGTTANPNPCLPAGVSHVVIAAKNADSTFTRLANSDEIMKNVNAIGCITDLSYQPVLSADNLEIFFTTAGFGGRGTIGVARRTSITEPFGVAQALNTGERGLAESGSVSLDGKHYYYHKATNSAGNVSAAIYVLGR